jgi:hypothetical protein
VLASDDGTGRKRQEKEKLVLELGDWKAETYVVNNLMRDAAVVLENIVVGSTRRCDELLGHRLRGLYIISLPRSSGYEQEGRLTRISLRWSSGISVSFAPWNLGMTSYIDSQASLVTDRR